jgi:hypothetical protein
MNPDLDSLLGKTQRQLAFFLLIVLVILVFAVLAILLIPRQAPVTPNAAIINLLVQVITGVLALCGVACGFFFARTRVNGIPDGSSTVTQTHTAPDGSKTTITSPAATTPVAVAAPVAPIPTNQEPAK